jgi:lipoprotein-releasing system permease protein
MSALGTLGLGVGVLGAAAVAPARLGRPKHTTALELIVRAWTWIGTGGRIALIGLAGAVVVWLLVLGLRRLGRGGRRSLLWGLTGLCFVGFAVLGSWSILLPEHRGSYFVMWHQLVRIGAALSATGFVLGALALLMPWLFNRFEGVGFVSFLATRHVRASKSGFLTVISFLSIAGVAVSSFALCATISIMGGFGADLKRKILGNNSHIKLDTGNVGGFDRWNETLRVVRRVGGVVAATPVAGGEAMASSSTNTAGVLVRGIDPSTIGSVIDLVRNIEVGRFEYLTHPDKLVKLPPEEPIGIGSGGQLYLKGPRSRSLFSDKLGVPEPQFDTLDEVYPGLIIGRELAKTLHVYIGDEVTLVSPLGDLGPMGVLPRSRQFRIAAVFYSGMYEYDSSQAYMLLDVAQEFLALEHRVTAIDVRVKNAEQVDEVRGAIVAAIGRKDLTVHDWKELNKKLFSALALEKIATFIILSIMIAVASFCIICTLLLMVTEKSKEIAILKAVGASDQAVLRVFMAEGMIIGAIGTIFGILTGWVSMLGLEKFGVRLDPEVYYVDRLPISVVWSDYLLVGVAAFAITTLATVYPALSASKLRPVDGIRYE